MELKLPDIGDFADVPVIEIHVAVGDRIEVDDPIVTLESDKATMDIPAPAAGVITELRVNLGDAVSEGTVIAIVDPADSGAATPDQPSEDKAVVDKAVVDEPAPAAATASSPTASSTAPPRGTVHAQLVVLGSGPGGYTAAFRAADLGLDVVMIEKYSTLGGVCLNVGCIPSKALLHVAKVVAEARESEHFGATFGAPSFDIDLLRNWKEGVVGRLTGGLTGLAKQRKVKIVNGVGQFTTPNMIEVTAADASTSTVSFEQAIIAVGSRAVTLPFIPHDDPRVIDSTGALALPSIPARLLVLGGGIIGLEMATVYEALGSKVTVVELMDQLIPGADRDLVAPLLKIVRKRYENIHLKTTVTAVTAGDDGLTVSFDAGGTATQEVFDAVLVAVGRAPNGALVGAETAGVRVSDRGFIPVDKQMRTNVAHIFAIGDVVGQPMLAHKATHEAKVAAEVAAGHKSFFDAKVIPSVAYTDPEVAWVGMTETDAKAQGVKYGKGAFPWAASGRSLSIGRDEGMTKLLFDEESGRIIGGAVVGPGAGELIAEIGLAIEMGSDAADIGLTVHPHPTLSETVGLAAEAFEGSITDLYMPKKRAH